MRKYIDGNGCFAVMHNYILDMQQGKTISQEILESVGMTGIYKPKPGLGSGKKNAVNSGAHFLLSGLSDPRHPGVTDLLRRNEDGTYIKL